MPVTTTYPYLQYGGIWTASQQADAKAAGTWPSPPVPLLYSWGSNSSGALGLGNTTAYSSPKQVGSDTNWLQIVAGGYNNTSAAIKTNGTLWMWGNNARGQLGNGNTTNYSSPVQIGALTGWLQVSTGRYRATAAIKTDGTLWMWGNNTFGSLGLGNTTDYSSPKQVGSGTSWSLVACGNASTFAIKTDGTLWSWGYNPSGQLGLGNTTYYSSPKQIGALTNWSKVNSVGNFCMAIKTDGTFWAWGVNNTGQLGLSDTTGRLSPVQVGALTNWSKISSGMTASLAIKTDGTLWAWGLNSSGQLGQGNTTNQSSPVQVGALTTWLYVVATYTSSYSIKTDGTLWSWGGNSFGQLGLGNTTNRSSPVQVGALTTWTTLSTFGGNANHMLAIALN
jgi:alpha-tubulin suppressor-like RCC1 family protein